MADLKKQQTQKNLVAFLDEAKIILDDTYSVIAAQSRSQPVAPSTVSQPTAESYLKRLEVIHRHAITKLEKTKSRIAKRLWWWQRKALESVGLYGEVLASKLDYLWDAVRDGLLSPILKMLNHILGSLSKVFSALHAVKEAKDTMEFVIDSLAPEKPLRVTPRKVISVR